MINGLSSTPATRIQTSLATPLPCNTDVKEKMFKAILFSLLSIILVLIVFGFLISPLLPAQFIAGSQMDWGHFTSCLLILPAALAGAGLVRKITGPNPRVA